MTNESRGQVIIARQNAEWRREYMDWKMTLLNERIKGREEGRAEGIEQGREEGRAEGIEQGRTEQLVESIKNLMSAGFDFEKAVEMLKVPAEQIDELRRLIFQNL